MSNEQLAVLLQYIETDLFQKLSKIREQLPEDMRVVSGEEGNLLNPLSYSYPVLDPFYDLGRMINQQVRTLSDGKLR